MACWTLGDEHPITMHMLESADRNLSLKKKMAVVERQRALDELVAQLQDEERLSTIEISRQLAVEKQDLIPVPERVWALRNTASTMALGDRRSRAKARDIFEMALQLQKQHMDDPGHPGLLGELWRCASAPDCEVQFLQYQFLPHPTMFVWWCSLQVCVLLECLDRCCAESLHAG